MSGPASWETPVGPDIEPAPWLTEFLTREGYIDGFVRPDGQVAFLLVTAAGQGQIGLGGRTSEAGVSDRWTFEHPMAAALAFRLWHGYGDDEPAGWIRHQPSNRRRTYRSSLTGYTDEIRGTYRSPLTDYTEEIRP